MSDVSSVLTYSPIMELFGKNKSEPSGAATPLTGAMKPPQGDAAATSAASQTDDEKRKKGLASLRFLGADKTGFASNSNTARAFLLAN